MKKFLFTIFCSSIVFLGSAQAPLQAVTNYKKISPKTEAVWIQQGKEWRAVNAKNADDILIFSDGGDFLGKETPTARNNMPAAIIENAQQRFEGDGKYTFEETAKRISPEGKVIYKYQYRMGETSVAVFYDENGKLFKRNVFPSE